MASRAGENITRIDHVAMTFSDLDAATEYYDRLFGLTTVIDHRIEGRPLVRQVRIGDILLSLHQAGNGVTPVAERPTVGAVDLCLRWAAPIEAAVALLNDNGVAIVDGPAPRTFSDGRPS